MKFIRSCATLVLVFGLTAATPLDDIQSPSELGSDSPQANEEGSLPVKLGESIMSNPQECHDPSTLDNRDLVLIGLSRKLDTIADSLTEDEKVMLDDLITSDGCTDEEVERAIEAHDAAPDTRVKRQTDEDDVCSVLCRGVRYPGGTCPGGRKCVCRCGFWNNYPSCKCKW